MKKEDKIPYGASGLTDEDLDFYLESHSDIQVKPIPVDSPHESHPGTILDNSIEIAKVLAECGLDSDVLQNPIFVKSYNRVATGPGRNWAPERRTKFTLQTMNRMGASDRVHTESPNLSVPDVQEPTVEEPSRGNNPADDLAFWGYHYLDRNEIIGNLTILGGILIIVLLAAGATYLCVSFNFSKGSAVAGTISLAAISAAVIRLAGKWHQRFPFRYRMVRLVVCMALLFSTAAWWAVKSVWLMACYVSDTTINILPFGLSLFGVLSIVSLVSHLKLCYTYEPRRARLLGWIEALALTFAIGAFLFCAVHKP